MKISVITPAYNVAPYIGATVTSVLAQSHQDWALIVVDDGSADATADIVAQYRDPRIRLIRQRNAGVAAARNRGIAEAASDAILFLDADDWLAPDALDRLAAALPGAVAAYGAYRFVSEEGEATGRTRSPKVTGDIVPKLLERNLFANGGHILMRRDAVAAAGVVGHREGLVPDPDLGAVPGEHPVLRAQRLDGLPVCVVGLDRRGAVACTRGATLSRARSLKP